jgi:hypothetical protein
MTLPSSGAISLSEVDTELGASATGGISMDQANVRSLAGVGGEGTLWGMNSLYGKSSTMTCALNTDSVSKTGTGLTTTQAVTCTPTGGTAPYTFSWTVVAGGGGITINSPSGQSTTFSATVEIVIESGVPHYETVSGTYHCTVHDSSGKVATSENLSVTIQS